MLNLIIKNSGTRAKVSKESRKHTQLTFEYDIISFALKRCISPDSILGRS